MIIELIIWIAEGVTQIIRSITDTWGIWAGAIALVLICRLSRGK